VSVLALVAGDRRLLDAQDRAASITFDYAEHHAAVTCIRQGKAVERVASDILVIAAFPHVTAPVTEDMPAAQLHTQGIVFNMTQRPG
jgi:conjugative relaxase-like TrwC/TraI family protein